ncbi:cytochrome P450 [Metabacillus bambusae]|uniref:Cytochrome P450 n=1 Tax=Metabacillus bambusae TaxID=2795218 RepID=A0ABS3MZG4_9BACI|nr:cytochrome P450 [Metabacillus bambusae]MBO1511210.1 cytochrome P450 [Metabacillus bambusae]
MINQSKDRFTFDITKCPYSFYEEIRSMHPVYKGSFFKYPGWYVTGYQEALTILKDNRFQTRILIPETTKMYEALKNIQSHMMLFKSPPDHGRLRKLVSHTFTPTRIEKYRPFIEKIAINLWNNLKNKKKIDVISDFAFPFASLVIAKIIGVPDNDKHIFREWALNLIQSIDLTRSRRSIVDGNNTTLEMLSYFKDLIKKRRQSPQNDLISELLLQEKEKKLTEEELLGTSVLLVIAGHETTVNLVSNSLYCFLTNPNECHKLIENPSLIESAIEECLRYESPSQMIARIASEDVELNKVQIKKGDHVYVLIGAANRDSKQFSNADVFDITRNPNPHLAFGSGIHFCLGSALARLEAQIAIQTILQNEVNIHLETKEVQWRKLAGFRAMKEMYVHFYDQVKN